MVDEELPCVIETLEDIAPGLHSLVGTRCTSMKLLAGEELEQAHH